MLQKAGITLVLAAFFLMPSVVSAFTPRVLSHSHFCRSMIPYHPHSSLQQRQFNPCSSEQALLLFRLNHEYELSRYFNPAGAILLNLMLPGVGSLFQGDLGAAVMIATAAIGTGFLLFHGIMRDSIAITFSGMFTGFLALTGGLIFPLVKDHWQRKQYIYKRLMELKGSGHRLPPSTLEDGFSSKKKPTRLPGKTTKSNAVPIRSTVRF